MQIAKNLNTLRFMVFCGALGGAFGCDSLNERQSLVSDRPTPVQPLGTQPPVTKGQQANPKGNPAGSLPAGFIESEGLAVPDLASDPDQAVLAPEADHDGDLGTGVNGNHEQEAQAAAGGANRDAAPLPGEPSGSGISDAAPEADEPNSAESDASGQPEPEEIEPLALYLLYCQNPDLPATAQQTIAIINAATGVAPDDCLAASRLLRGITHFAARPEGPGITDTTLYVGSDSGITDLVPLTALPALTSVDATGLPLTSLKILGQLPQLASLTIRDNAQFRSYFELKDLTTLRHLVIENPTAQSFGFLQDLPQLESLAILNNLSFTNTDLDYLTAANHLKDLDLSGAIHLTNLDYFFLPAVEVFTASRCGLKNIDQLISLNALGREIDLSFNQITDFPTLAAPNLSKLNLAGNPAVAGYAWTLHYSRESLQDLDLSGVHTRNELTYVLPYLTALKSLKLADTRLQDPSLFAGMVALEHLALQDNFFCETAAFAALPNLKFLDLRNNYILTPDQAAAFAAKDGVQLRWSGPAIALVYLAQTCWPAPFNYFDSFYLDGENFGGVYAPYASSEF